MTDFILQFTITIVPVALAYIKLQTDANRLKAQVVILENEKRLWAAERAELTTRVTKLETEVIKLEAEKQDLYERLIKLSKPGVI